MHHWDTLRACVCVCVCGHVCAQSESLMSELNDPGLRSAVQDAHTAEQELQRMKEVRISLLHTHTHTHTHTHKHTVCV